MGFFTGRVSSLRFKVNGAAPRQSSTKSTSIALRIASPADNESLPPTESKPAGPPASTFSIPTFSSKRTLSTTPSRSISGWTRTRSPAISFAAYYAVELKALSKKNPSGFASGKQKREAKEIARDRLEQEAKDGRYRKRKCIPVLWDRLSNEVLFGATSISQIDRLTSLFEQTFGAELECVTAGRRAYHLAELHSRTRMVDDSAPSAFVPGVTPQDVAWIADDTSRDFIGNEFLLWLWYHTDVESDTIKLVDKSEVTLMLARTLTLECPRGQTGHETISSEGPSQLPEAKRAIQSGKLPRKVGLTLVRHSEQYELTLHAETLAVSSAKLPPPDESISEARAKLDERASQIRNLIETLDLLYDAFGQKRFGKDWDKELAGMQKWLKREERRAA